MLRYLGNNCFDAGLPSRRIIGPCAGHGQKAEFLAKMGIVVEESDEAVLWLELLSESGIISGERIADLLGEARELTAIFTASLQTAKGAVAGS
jgi:four helix bundle protein